MSFSLLAGCSKDEKNQIDDKTVQTEILNEFTKMAQIPRESGHERAISSYLKTWAKENGFNVIRDKSNNIIIEVPATAGYESAPTTILQSNMDMYCIAAENTDYNPLVNPINVIKNEKTYIGSGTNLGAKSGIGMATALYVLKHSDKHGPLRVIFTVDGESGFKGADNLNTKYLEGKYLINLNWNAKDAIGSSSAGTVSYEMTRHINWVAPKNTIPYEISISGLNGGDSRKNINDGNANAVKIIGETLAKAQGQGILFELGAFNGGIAKDTIPTAANALIIINDSDQKKLNNILDSTIDNFKSTYGDVEKNGTFTYYETTMPDKVVSFEDNGSIMSFIYGIINGVQTTSDTFTDMVESSSNLGMVSTTTGNFIADIFAAGNTVTSLQNITSEHEAISSMSALEYKSENNMPVWTYNPDNTLNTQLQTIWKDSYGIDAKLDAVHYELECSKFIEKNPNLQMASIGPYIKNIDTPEETLQLDSVTKPATVILKFLEQIKD